MSKDTQIADAGQAADLARYDVQFVPIESITPSPENDDIYGPIKFDVAMNSLIESIERKGLAEPILVTADPKRYILSGHRRYFALDFLDYKEVPVRIAHGIRREGNAEYHRELTEYNPQRVKSVGSILKEALLRDNNAADTYAAIKERREASLQVEAEFMEVDRAKLITAISDRRMGFLKAVQGVVERLKPYWPLSIRQIHYQLLNDPPLKQAPRRSKYDLEQYRYQNDSSSYNSLVDLLTPARHLRFVPENCIDDPTRPQKQFGGWYSVANYVSRQIETFLTGFHRNRQQDQTRHIEVFAEKNTLYKLIERACAEYYVPFSIGRGFCSYPVWRDMDKRFAASGKERMTLIIVSDYDPAGLNLADDAIRSLELRGVPVDGHRIAITPEQIEELGLAEDFNPAKDGSPGILKAFIERTGSDKTWEVEALPPEYLVSQVKAAIEANMDMEVYEEVCDQEEMDCMELCDIREQIAGQLEI